LANCFEQQSFVLELELESQLEELELESQLEELELESQLEELELESLSLHSLQTKTLTSELDLTLLLHSSKSLTFTVCQPFLTLSSFSQTGFL